MIHPQTEEPNGPGLHEWPEFDASQARVMYLGKNIAPGPVVHRKQLEFFDTVFVTRPNP